MFDVIDGVFDVINNLSPNEEIYLIAMAWLTNRVFAWSSIIVSKKPPKIDEFKRAVVGLMVWALIALMVKSNAYIGNDFLRTVGDVMGLLYVAQVGANLHKFMKVVAPDVYPVVIDIVKKRVPMLNKAKKGSDIYG